MVAGNYSKEMILVHMACESILLLFSTFGLFKGWQQYVDGSDEVF